MPDHKRGAIYAAPLIVRALVYIGIGLALVLWGRWAFPPILTITGGIVLVALGVRCAWRAARNRITRKDIDRIKDPFTWG